ncbi:glycoside hydrolase [Eremomyces bilateralis CBS 781.70]|uniref:Mannan endo-1,6-alpha-mannosidase n=1 Tax=Eremomyces bilateralis CBS 781.70 TaxID=1392243 RepID=A0A6G1FZS7_9PEZI|nr:glycoside hydrolase [Eremomyces bilateralis CBS 781.70]KAF1811304.1 glycoside hydrolase [Eremomyces bilateralis CBS 781.70]
MRLFRAIAFATLTLTTDALSLDLDSIDSTKDAAKSVAKGVLADYPGTQSENAIGVWNSPYYFWSAGAVWDALVDYWHLTGDSSYNDLVAQALQAQIGPEDAYMPLNQTATLMNEDQFYWGRAALTAAERDFVSPSNSIPYVRLASNVFDTQVLRWDTESCNGGLRRGIFPFNNGYNYKNAGSNAGFFQLAARLARVTGNDTYSDWASKTFDWLETIGLVGPNGAVYDGTKLQSDCSEINHIEWTVNSGLLLHGSAIMYNITNGSPQWRTRVEKLMERSSIFFDDGIMIEAACEPFGTCNIDHRFYKGIFASNLAQTAQYAPFSASTILPLLRSSAQGAASNACPDADGFCSYSWTPGTGSNVGGSSDLGHQLSALQVIQANLVPHASGLALPGSLPSGPGSLTSIPGNSSSASGDATSPSQTPGGDTNSASTSRVRDHWVAVAAVLVVAVLGYFG